MEIPMAATGSASKGASSALSATRHKFPAAIHSVATDIGRMVPLALHVSDASCAGDAGIPSRQIFPHNHLSLLHCFFNPINIQFTVEIFPLYEERFDGEYDRFLLVAFTKLNLTLASKFVNL